jgi:hypothetical protein
LKKKILNTDARRKAHKSKERAVSNLHARGWSFDGLWWTSPYTKLRYAKREAIDIEELRAWAEGESAFLLGKSHSMWVKKEMEDNRLISWEELVHRNKQAKLVKQAAIDTCYGKSVE